LLVAENVCLRQQLGVLQRNAISERWVTPVRAECLDHLFIFNEAGLRLTLKVEDTRCHPPPPSRITSLAIL